MARTLQTIAQNDEHPEGSRIMPEERTKRRAAKDKAEGKSPSTQAGEFVREEIEHVREGKHGARSSKQAIAIGLSKARRAGVELPPPKSGRTSKRTQRSAARDSARGRSEPNRKPSPRRSRATTEALEREPRAAATRTALSWQARAAARTRGSSARKAAARKAARTRAARGTNRSRGARARQSSAAKRGSGATKR